MSFYLMHRGWMDNAVFEEQPYGERDVWCYLIEHAGYVPSKMRHNFDMITVGRGQVPTSYRKLADKFKWSVNRVRRFLELLENEGMISRKTDTGFLVITLCNYEKYQNTVKNTDTPSDTQSNTWSDTRSDTNIKNIKEIKETLSESARARVQEIFPELEKIIDSPTPLFSSPIEKWFEAGATADDIREAARVWKERNPQRAMRSLAWLDDLVASAIHQRTNPMPQANGSYRQTRDPPCNITLDEANELIAALNS